MTHMFELSKNYQNAPVAQIKGEVIGTYLSVLKSEYRRSKEATAHSTPVIALQCTIDQILENDAIFHMFVEHYDEIATHKDIKLLKPHMGFYETLENNNLFFAIVLTKDEIPIGYSFNFKSSHAHYKDLFLFKNDIIFLTKRHRRDIVEYEQEPISVGGLLVKLTEELGKRSGCQQMLWHVKPNTQAYNRFVKSDYAIDEYVFSKRL